MERRTFIKYSGIFTVSASLGLISCTEDNDPQPNLGNGISLDLTEPPFDELQQTGSWVLHPDLNLILVNFEGTIRAFTSVCTHSQCSRNWVFGSTEATCTCHGSKFDYAGRVVRGPAQRDLQTFDVVVDGNSVSVS